MLTNEFIYTPFMKIWASSAIYVQEVRAGEPSEEMSQVIRRHPTTATTASSPWRRHSMDLCKLLGCKRPRYRPQPVLQAIPRGAREGDVAIHPPAAPALSAPTSLWLSSRDEKDGVLTGGETKLGLVSDDIIPNKVCLIPELLKTLPYKPFACSAIDATGPPTESFLSPTARP